MRLMLMLYFVISSYAATYTHSGIEIACGKCKDGNACNTDGKCDR